MEFNKSQSPFSTSWNNSNIKFEQKISRRKQEYIYHIYEIFYQCVGTPPTIRNIKGSLRNRESI